jgi:hypothetical protein
MKVSGQIQVPVVLTPIYIVYEDKWSTEAVWMRWSKVPAGNRVSIAQPEASHFIDSSIPAHQVAQLQANKNEFKVTLLYTYTEKIRHLRGFIWSDSCY